MPKIDGLEVHVADKGCTCLYGRTSPERRSEQLLTSRRLNKDATVRSLHMLERTMKRHLMTLHCTHRIPETSSQTRNRGLKRTFELPECPHSLAELSRYLHSKLRLATLVGNALLESEFVRQRRAKLIYNNIILHGGERPYPCTSM